MSLEGRLEDLRLADIFQIISLSKRSGVLTLIRKEGTGRLVFNQGHVVFASSDTRSRLGYTLVKKGIITNEDLEYALRVQKGRGSKKPIGTLLLEMGALDQETFDRELHNHVISVVHDLLSWDSGSFYFELGSMAEEEIASKVGFNTEALLLEALRLQDEEERDKPSIPPQPQTKGSEQPVSVLPESLDTTQVAGPTTPAMLHGRKDLHLLAAMIAELSGPASSSELTLMILRFASEMMSRAVIFLVRKDDIVGLGQFGLSFPKAEEQERIRSVRIPLSAASALKDAAENKKVYKGALYENEWHRYLIDHLGKEWPEEVFIAPLICEGRTIAVLYGDNVPNRKPIAETEGLEAFIKVAGFAFGKALLERKLQETKPTKT